MTCIKTRILQHPAKNPRRQLFHPPVLSLDTLAKPANLSLTRPMLRHITSDDCDAGSRSNNGSLGLQTCELAGKRVLRLGRVLEKACQTDSDINVELNVKFDFEFTLNELVA